MLLKPKFSFHGFCNIFNQNNLGSVGCLIEHGFTSAPTQYRLYGQQYGLHSGPMYERKTREVYDRSVSTFILNACNSKFNNGKSIAIGPYIGHLFKTRPTVSRPWEKTTRRTCNGNLYM